MPVLVVAALALTGCTSLLEPLLGPLRADRPVTVEDDDFGTVDVYRVDDSGDLVPDARGSSAEVWKTFTRVVTPELTAAVMVEYLVGDSAESDTLAYVYQADDPEYWVLAANLDASDDESLLLATLIHEYAHILTLGVEQVDTDAATCATLDVSEGCALPDSTLTAFEAEFWADYGTDAPEPDNVDVDLAWEFYLDHEDDFVNDYAATNVVEDLAESFTAFVLEDETDADSDTVIGEKIGFFWAYPEYVAIRERIRTEFAGEAGLPFS